MSILKQILDDFTADDKGVFNSFTLQSNQYVRGRQDVFISQKSVLGQCYK